MSILPNLAILPILQVLAIFVILALLVDSPYLDGLLLAVVWGVLVLASDFDEYSLGLVAKFLDAIYRAFLLGFIRV